MLYDFHKNQNAKKPGTIHATYLISGTKRIDETTPKPGGIKKDGEDDYMASSSFMSSSMPQPEEGTGESSVLSITLVKEENLEGRYTPSPVRSTGINHNIQQELKLNTTKYSQYKSTA